ncbi:MAG: 2-oxo acid dehydrogenase subunit E2 [Sphingomonadales bacterium]|nr:2-oxo acid dehydrogenase subunit E2 [Sphingomonadales bacterium]
MARFTFKLPDIGEGIAEAEIVAWHVQPGDRVEEDGALCDVMTDKATVEMESPVAGTVIEVAGKAGDMVAIGSPLVVFEVEGEDEATPPPQYIDVVAEPELPAAVAAEAEPVQAPETPAPAAPAPLPGPSARKVLASPAVRARAKELEIDLAQVRAEGPHLRHADLDAFLRYGAAQGYGVPAAARADEAVPVIGMRRRIAENMAAAKRAIPHFSYVEEIEVTQLEELRAQLNSGRGERPKLTLLPLLIAAICKTIPEFPMLNARYDDEAGVVTRHGAVHLGIATQTPAGLMVPVIRDAQARNIWQLAGEIARLADAARNGTARREELAGSTLTITSLGPLGGVATTPVINRPEVAIIGPNRIIERPVFVDGSSDRVRRAKLMNLSISCDHRVVDGWDAASFVQALKRLIEAPALILAG